MLTRVWTVEIECFVHGLLSRYSESATPIRAFYSSIPTITVDHITNLTP